jgi:isoamylase
LGVTWLQDELAVNFALYSQYATDVTLLISTNNDSRDSAIQHWLNYLKNKFGRVWHCRIPASQVFVF